MAISFSPDGKRLATAGRDNLIKLWEVNRGLELLSLSGHQKEVWSLTFSPDGRLLASGSYDGTVRLWRAVPENEVVKPLPWIASGPDTPAFTRRRREPAAVVPQP
jgi:WD40 repeat protein